MKKTVKAGPAMDLAKKALDVLFRGLDRAMADLEDKGLEKKKEENIEEEGIKGKYLLYETANGQVLEVKLFGVEEHPDYYIVRVRIDEDESTAKESEKPLKKNQISKFITDYADANDLGTVEEGVDVNDNVGMEKDDLFQSTKISVTLQRVSAGDEDTINLCAINASNAVKAMNMLDEILSDDEFVATITAEPASFEITENEDEYTVEDTDKVDTSHTFEEMLKACVECYHNLQTIHWGARCHKFNDIHSFTESLMWDVKYQIDTIAEWCVEFTNKVPNVLTYQYTPLVAEDGFDFDLAMSATKCQLDNYIKVLECFYVNLDHDVQSVMDNWIREFKKKSNYVLDRTLMPECTTECPHTL